MAMRKKDRTSAFRTPFDTTRRSILLAGTATIVAPLLPRWARAQVVSTEFDYYISPTGSDSNSGTRAAPWAISALGTKAQISGRRVGLLDGTYVASSTDAERPGILVGFGGTAGAPTIIEAVNPRQAIITGYNGSRYVGLQGLIGVNGASYVTFRGLRVTNGVCKGFAIWNSSNIIVENSEVSNFRLARYPGYTAMGDNTEGVRIEGSSDVTIRNCQLFDVANGADNWNGSLVKTYATNRTVIEYCDFSDAYAGHYDKSASPQNTTIRNCYFHDIHWPLCGFDQVSTGTHRIYNNVIEGAVAITMVGDGSANCAIEVYNNTVFGTTATDGIWNLNAGGALLKFYNNIVYHPGVSATYHGDLFTTSAAPVINYNCYTPGAIRIDSESDHTTLASWQSTGRDTNSIQANPAFVGDGTGASRFKLSASSPCRDAGRIGGLASGAVTDIGAWQDGVTQIGCDFTANVGVAPNPPGSVVVE